MLVVSIEPVELAAVELVVLEAGAALEVVAALEVLLEPVSSATE